jgi:predicted lipoprotein with Yx(FWY)xxD motif
MFAVVLGVAALLDASHAVAQSTGERNGILTNAEGRTLYTYDKDGAGVSNCTGGCAFAWPPLLAEHAAMDNGAFTQITRADGRRQWAHDGKPLYRYIGDIAAGDVHGDNKGGVWHVVKIDVTQASGAKPPSSSHQADGYDYDYKP